MAIRPFAGVQTIGAASQPVFGTTMNAVGILIPDQFSGNTNPGSNQSKSVIPVSSVAGFRVGDLVAIAPKANFNPLTPGFLDAGQIKSINTITPSLTVQGLTVNHASGEYVLLDEDASFVSIVPVVTAAKLYLGNSPSVDSSDASVFDVIPALGAGQLTYWHQSQTTDRANSYSTIEFWTKGTANDTFVARFSQV